MREAIERVIAELSEQHIYAEMLLKGIPADRPARYFGFGKQEGLGTAIKLLQEVLARDTGATYNRNTANAERDTPHAPSRTGQAEKEMAASGDD